MEILRLVVILLLIILIIVIGNSYVNDSKFAVLTGTITTPTPAEENLIGLAYVNYPSGFNKTNCVVISIMGGRKNDATILTTPMPVDAAAQLLGVSGLAATLNTDNIAIRKEKLVVSEPSSTTAFKLVLMKIS